MCMVRVPEVFTYRLFEQKLRRCERTLSCLRNKIPHLSCSKYMDTGSCCNIIGIAEVCLQPGLPCGSLLLGLHLRVCVVLKETSAQAGQCLLSCS